MAPRAKAAAKATAEEATATKKAPSRVTKEAAPAPTKRAASVKPTTAKATAAKATTKREAASAPRKRAASVKPTAAAMAAAEKEKAPARKRAASVKPTAKTAAKKEATPAPRKRAASVKPTTNGAASKKRKADEDLEEEDSSPVQKKTKTVKAPKRAATPAVKKVEDTRPQLKIGQKINNAPTQLLDIYVFGEGSSGELGLGSARVNGKKPIDVKRPRLNDKLSAQDVGIVHFSAGGMHAIALTHDNKILTWGVNDQGALGRETTWDGGLKDIAAAEDSDSEADDDDSGLNPKESTPTAVDDNFFALGTKFVQVIACDSASFAVTEDGHVYGWGTFRSSDGILGFTEQIRIQNTPMLIPELKKITSLASGSNHILALDIKGNVFAWGCGQQNQLGRRIIERNKLSSLTPQGVGLPRGKIVKVACGSYHSFAIDKSNNVWGWGLNNFGETGIEGNAGEDAAVILKPAKVELLENFEIADIDGGGHHSVACSTKGELITWGRVDGFQVGIDPKSMTEDNAIFDDRNTPRILFIPSVVPGKSQSSSHFQLN